MSTYECPTSPNPSTSGVRAIQNDATSHAKYNESFEPDKDDKVVQANKEEPVSEPLEKEVVSQEDINLSNTK